MSQRNFMRGLGGCLAFLLLLNAAATTFGQDGATANLGGVLVDAEGVLRMQFFRDPTGDLNRQRVEAAKAALNPKVAAESPIRKISLNRLEAAIEAQLNNDRQPTEEMRYLAGLTRVQYVFFYPETNDIVIAGPAEGWAADISGRVRGINSGKPVVELQDLVVALRMFPPGSDGGPTIGCSIDATPEGLANMQAFLKQMGGTITPDTDIQSIARGLRTSLGLQTVRVLGVPPDTHFAQVLVEADYRMKLIGIGLEAPPVKMNTFISRASPSGSNGLQRWYFMPNYNCVRVGDDDQSMELDGLGVKLVSADEVVSADGSRGKAATVNKASRAYCEAFTQKYPAIAARSPVFAQLRNLIDLSIAAAFIQQRDYYGKAGWTPETLLDEELVPVETFTTPVMVESAINPTWKGGRLMLPIGGGVNIQAALALDAANLLDDEQQNLPKLREGITLDNLADGQWWWD
jgi:hypothetical protein